MFRVVNYSYVKYYPEKNSIMKNIRTRWVTVRFKENIFDVKFKDKRIDEIRAVDSEVNILNLVDHQTLSDIQNLVKENFHAV